MLTHRIMLFVCPASTVLCQHARSSAEQEAIVTLAAFLAYPTRPCGIQAGAGLLAAAGTGLVMAVRATYQSYSGKQVNQTRLDMLHCAFVVCRRKRGRYFIISN